MLERTSLGEIVLELLARINRSAVGSYAGLAIHSGAVAIEGRVVAFPGSTGVGESTLAAACALISLDYVCA